MCVVVVVVFAQKKNFRIGHKSVQNGANPYKQFFGQNTRTKTTKLGIDENRMNNFNNINKNMNE